MQQGKMVDMKDGEGVTMAELKPASRGGKVPRGSDLPMSANFMGPKLPSDADYLNSNKGRNIPVHNVGPEVKNIIPDCLIPVSPGGCTLSCTRVRTIEKGVTLL